MSDHLVDFTMVMTKAISHAMPDNTELLVCLTTIVAVTLHERFNDEQLELLLARFPKQVRVALDTLDTLDATEAGR